MRLIVGLGNPGAKYKNNRHNVGFLVLDQLASTCSASAWQSNFDGLVAETYIGSEKVLLLKPMTFMNRSGRSVRKAVDFYKLDIANVLVICDDFSLPLGKLRLRAKGSAGGQNGLKDIIAHLGTDEISRMRVGIGAPGADTVDYVLSDFAKSEQSIVTDMVIDAGRAAELWCRSGIQAAMNEFNGREPTKE
jgi:PTH1 family peptidyl-tRNA hydrolase